jgi:hypothetical protein
MRRMLGLMTFAGLMTLAVLMLTGCGGSDGVESDTAGEQLLTVAAVVDELGYGGVNCRDLKMSGQGSEGQSQLFTREDGRCSIGDEDVNVVTFDGPSQRDQYLEAAKQLGGIYVTGETWVVGTETQPTPNNVQDALGGEMP